MRLLSRRGSVVQRRGFGGFRRGVLCGRRGNPRENEEKEVLEGLFRVVRGDTQSEKRGDGGFRRLFLGVESGIWLV